MSDSGTRVRSSSAPSKAIAFMLMGTSVATVNDALLKWMSSGYSVGQIMFCRGIFIALPLAVLIWRAGGLACLRPVNPTLHFIRAGLVVCGTFLFVSGLRFLPLTDAVAIAFAGPLFVTALAPRLLGEYVGWRRWMAVAAGFVGILVIMRPGGTAIQWAALLPLGASLSGAFRDILTRKMSAHESTVAILFYTSLGVTLAGLMTVPFAWAPVSWNNWGLFLLSGLFIGSGHFLMIETYRYGEAALVAPFKYSGVIWAALLGFLIWGDVPDAGTVTGVSVVIFSSLYIMHREQVRRRE